MDSNRSTVTGCRRWICVDIPNSIDALYRTGRSRGLSPAIESGEVYAFDCVKRTPSLAKEGNFASSPQIRQTIKCVYFRAIETWAKARDYEPGPTSAPLVL